ncbi:MAG: hypothetical protein KF802_05060 [Bdellovibrionaceae bacterium]|nr:hypothetical protein [Pseudobdellovibrionaceae bacterium]
MNGTKVFHPPFSRPGQQDQRCALGPFLVARRRRGKPRRELDILFINNFYCSQKRPTDRLIFFLPTNSACRCFVFLFVCFYSESENNAALLLNCPLKPLNGMRKENASARCEDIATSHI